MNPACRAARQFPGLTLSRLLMSLNDDDIPSELGTPNAPLGSERGGGGRGERGHNYEEGGRVGGSRGGKDYRCTCCT